MSEEKKKSKPVNRNTFVKGILRRASFHWKPRTEAMQLSRVERGKYKCAMCEDLFGPKEIILDHIQPVVDPKQGFVGFDSFIERLFCDVDGFQVLCKVCSDAKTLMEDQMRTHYRTQKEEFHNFKKKKKKKLDKVTEEE